MQTKYLSEMPATTPKRITFAVAATDDRKTLGLCSGAVVGPDRITNAIRLAMAGRNDVRIEAAGPARFVLKENESGSTAIFGTAAAVHFDEPQSVDALRGAAYAIQRQLQAVDLRLEILDL